MFVLLQGIMGYMVAVAFKDIDPLEMVLGDCIVHDSIIVWLSSKKYPMVADALCTDIIPDDTIGCIL